MLTCGTRGAGRTWQTAYINKERADQVVEHDEISKVRVRTHVLLLLQQTTPLVAVPEHWIWEGGAHVRVAMCNMSLRCRWRPSARLPLRRRWSMTGG